jgi:hypothetical protein
LPTRRQKSTPPNIGHLYHDFTPISISKVCSGGVYRSVPSLIERSTTFVTFCQTHSCFRRCFRLMPAIFTPSLVISLLGWPKMLCLPRKKYRATILISRIKSRGISGRPNPGLPLNIKGNGGGRSDALVEGRRNFRLLKIYCGFFFLLLNK